MIFDLPLDLADEILSRVPLKSKKAMRLTCKNWNAYLTRMHQDKLAAPVKEGESRIIAWIHNDLYLTSLFLNQNPSIKHLRKLTCLSEQVKISNIFHCQGLLLCILQNDNTKVVVWNPYLGQTRWIETRYPNRRYAHNYTYAFGCVNNKNNKSLSNYKILRFYTSYFNEDEDLYLVCDIYDFDSSDSWKIVHDSQHWLAMRNGVSLKGNTYWCVSRTSEDRADHIICFDFTRERFGPLMPLPFKRHDNSVTLSCVREEKLAALVDYKIIHLYEIDIWITTKIKTKNVLWSKLFKVDTYPLYDPEIFINEEKKVVMAFKKRVDTNPNHLTLKIIGEAGYLRNLDFGECGKDGWQNQRCVLLCSKFSANQTTCKWTQKEETKRLRKASI